MLGSAFEADARAPFDLRDIPDDYEEIPHRTAATEISVCRVEQIPWSPAAQQAFQEKVDANKWEGMIIRCDAPYEGKKTKRILKVKSFESEDYVVTGIETGEMLMINPKSGLEESVETMTAAHIVHKGQKVSVGSGWSHAERNQFFEDPSGIVGKTIEVRYFEETVDKDGKVSLRFPTKRVIWGDKRDL